MATGYVAEAQELARQSISDLMLEALEPGSTIFTDFVSHLCHAFRCLGTETMSGPDGELQGRLYAEIAGCASPRVVNSSAPGLELGPMMLRAGETWRLSLSGSSVREQLLFGPTSGSPAADSSGLTQVAPRNRGDVTEPELRASARQGVLAVLSIWECAGHQLPEPGGVVEFVEMR